MPEITGRLEGWVYSGGRIYGAIYDDPKNRWKDGVHIRTALVVSTEPTKDGNVVHTEDSSYLLGECREPEHLSAKGMFVPQPIEAPKLSIAEAV